MVKNNKKKNIEHFTDSGGVAVNCCYIFCLIISLGMVYYTCYKNCANGAQPCTTVELMINLLAACCCPMCYIPYFMVKLLVLNKLKFSNCDSGMGSMDTSMSVNY